MSSDVPTAEAADAAEAEAMPAPAPAGAQPRDRGLRERLHDMAAGLRQGLRSRIGRQVAVAAVAISAFAAVGHFLGGLIGWWHAYEVVFGHPSPRPLARTAPPLSLAVLPFRNEGAAEEAWLAENLTSDVATELSRTPGSSVIGREAAARYVQKDLDARQAASELGVRYLLLGDVQRHGESVRLRVRLLDGQTGAQRWADRFDLERSMLPKVVDELALRLARAVDVHLHRSEGQRAGRLPPEETQADDLAMQGFGILYAGVSEASARRALAVFEQALQRDPESVRGWSGVAMSTMYLTRWSGGDPEPRRRLEQAVARLQVLDPTGLATLHTTAYLPLARRDFKASLASADQMAAHYPGHHAGHTMRATALVRMGRFEEALEATDRALTLLPNDPDSANRWRRSFIMFALGRHDEAAAQARVAIASTSNSTLSTATLLAALVRGGKAQEARDLLERVRGQQPGFLAALKRVLPVLRGDGDRYRAVHQDFLDALKAAHPDAFEALKELKID